MSYLVYKCTTGTSMRAHQYRVARKLCAYDEPASARGPFVVIHLTSFSMSRA